MAKPSSDRIKVSIIGTHLLFNEAIGSLLDKLPGIYFVGQFPEFEEPLKAITNGSTELVLLISPEASSLTPILSLIGRQAKVRALCLSTEWTAAQALEHIQAGALGCIAADISAEELGAAVRQAARGEVALSKELQQEIILSLSAGPSIRTDPITDLTSREADVLTLVCEGLSNKQIAQNLYLSVRTVENHLGNIYSKLGVSSRTEAAVLALQNGWVRPKSMSEKNT